MQDERGKGLSSAGIVYAKATGPVIEHAIHTNTSERSWAFGASTPWNVIRCSRGRGTNANSRCMNSSGPMTR